MVTGPIQTQGQHFGQPIVLDWKFDKNIVRKGGSANLVAFMEEINSVERLNLGDCRSHARAMITLVPYSLSSSSHNLQATVCWTGNDKAD